MGAHKYEDEGPKMCFNGAKSWYIGWYNDRHIEITPSNSWAGRLAAVDDYTSTVGGTHYIIAKAGDLFVMYNRAKGVNSEVQGYADLVTVVEQTSRTAQSWVVASLDAGQQQVIGSVVVEVCGFVSDSTVDYAHVVVRYDGGPTVSCSNTLPPIGSPSPTPVPTPFPTQQPTPSPTPQPLSPTNNDVLTTTMDGLNGADGNQFDVRALTTSIDIESFDIHLQGSNAHVIEIYSKTGSYSGHQKNSTSWNHIQTFTGIQANGRGSFTFLPNLSAPITVFPGETRSFYVTVSPTGGSVMRYSDGASGSEFNVFASDSHLEICTGNGNVHPFGQTFQPRIWNGRIHYSLTQTTSPPPTPQPSPGMFGK